MRDMFSQLADVETILQASTPLADSYNRTSVPVGYLGNFNAFGTQLRNIATIINHKKSRG